MSEPTGPEETPIPARLADSEGASAPSPAPVPPSAPQFDDRPPSSAKSRFEAESSPPGRTRREESAESAESPAERHRRMVGAEPAEPRQRRVALPVILFLITCVSTFWAGCAPGQAGLVLEYFFQFLAGETNMLSATDARIRLLIIENWHNGLIYMACVLGILFAHEMGHFLMTLRYRIAASLPYFLPVPFTPIGTMGAVISMDGLSANRKQIFDIGIAGPLAGLVLAIPITWYGVSQLDVSGYNDSHIDEYRVGIGYHMPWAVNAMIDSAQPTGFVPGQTYERIPSSKMNPFLLAGWVGLLITGLNMMPISQLDGGHVIYALFGKHAHTLARLSLFVAIFFVVYYFDQVYFWTVMIILVTLMGTDHPPTADDSVQLGPARTILGFVSLSIPFLCFPFFGLWDLSI